jgi:rhamnose transport system ATP-binding protein
MDQSDSQASAGPVIVAAEGLTMAFGGVDVLRNASVQLRGGEVHGLVGENGAGKSTLAKLIGGVYSPKAGKIFLDGEPVEHASPRAAMARGVALIHQEPLTFPDLTVAENIFIGRQPRVAGRVDWAAMTRRAGEILDSLGVKIDARAKVRGLSIADQQMVEMAAALSQNARVFLMDETTAALTPHEVKDLFRIMDRLRKQGAALAFIGHRMEEIFGICDHITVLRDGEIVADRRTAQTSVPEILKLMVGRSMDALFSRQARHEIGQPLLEVQHLSRSDEFQDISFHVRAGEIVGLAGLVGAGRTEVARAIFGITTPDAGRISVEGKPARIGSPRQAMRRGLAMVPEDRQHHGVLMPASVWQNATLPIAGRLSFFGWLRDGKAKSATLDYVRRLGVRLRSITQPIRELSGGNAQKIVIAKWLLTRPRVMILDEPTRGIDIGAKAEVHRLIAELAAAGMAVLMISSELPEVLAMSDRILVMREGKLVRELTRAEATPERVIAAATGQAEAEVHLAEGGAPGAGGKAEAMAATP